MDEEPAMTKVQARQAAWDRGVIRLGELSSQLAQVHALMVEEAAALLVGDAWAGDGGVRTPQHFLQVFGWLSPAHANQLIAVARRKEELPETVELMRAGRLSLDQATVVAQYVPAEYSAGGAELAEKMTVPQLRRTLSRYCFQDGAATPKDPGAPAEREAGPELTMHSHGRRFRLEFTAWRDDGALVEQAIREAKDALFTAGNPTATLADGFLAMAARSLGDIALTSRREHYKVMIHLNVDGTGWLGKKGALPETLMRRFTCEGNLTPVWEKNSTPVAVGRTQRIVPERVRRLIEDRDRGCRYPACPVTAFLENHHLIHWADGGPTNPENLLSLCPFHHSSHHKGAFTIAGDPTTPHGLVFTTHRGYPIAPITPSPPPTPPGPTPPNTEILRGDWCDTQWLQIPPNIRPVHVWKPGGREVPATHIHQPQCPRLSVRMPSPNSPAANDPPIPTAA